MKEDESIFELEEIYADYLRMEQDTEKRRQQAVMDYQTSQCTKAFLSSYLTVTEDGIPTVYDLVWGGHTFESLKQAYEFYEVLIEGDPLNMEYRLILFQLKSCMKGFKGYEKESLSSKNRH